MANQKISQLTAVTSVASADYFPVVVNATTSNARVSVASLLASIPAGSAASPSIAFTGDTNTGIYSPGADQVAISTSGAGRLFVDASGRVGVGASTGYSPLTVRGLNNTITLDLNSTTANDYSAITWNGSTTDLTSNPTCEVRGYRVASAAGELGFHTRTAGGISQERLRITSSGLVGIGTSAPGARLHVTDLAATAVELLRLQVNLNSPSGNKSITWADATDVVGRISIDYTSPTAKMRFGSLYNNGYQTSDLMTLTPTGLGIGTTTPNASTRLHVDSGATGGVATFSSSDSVADIWLQASGTGAGGLVRLRAQSNSMVFMAGSSGPSERARIDDSGRLLVGTSSARSNIIGLAPGIQLEGSNNSTQRSFAQIYGKSDSSGPLLVLSKHRSDSVGGQTIVSSGDELGQVIFAGSDGTNFVQGAVIKAEVDGAPSANDMPSRLVFSTTADGASSPTERMRITSNGKVIVNDTTAVLDATFSVLAQSGNNAIALKSNASTTFAALGIWCNETSGNQIFSRFATDSNAERGSIDYNRAAGQVRYNVTSDRRLKSDIQPASTALDTLAAIQVRSYKWAETGYQVDHGFIAQELNEIAPDAVKVGDDGEEVTDSWAVDNGKLVPLLVKALQEAIAKIETLEARLSALESA